MPHSHVLHVARALGVGAVCGGRSMAGPAALAWSRNRTRPSRLTRIATPATLLAIAGETVADKLPKTPSRLQQPGLSVRLLAGAGAAAALTVDSRRPSATIVAAALGAAGGYLGSRAGALWRSSATRWFHGDLVGALIEDAVVDTGAFLLTRNAFRPTLTAALHGAR